MTYVLLNEENQTVLLPPVNKDNICNYDQSPELLERDGYVYVEQNLIDLFNQGKGKIENNTISDITTNPDYKLSQFQNAIQYQHDAFNEYSSATNSQIKTLESLYNANIRANNTSEASKLETLIEGLEDDLLTEQQAVIARINAITEVYNANI